MYNAFGVKELVQREPWRAGQGRPKNALDPTWAGVPKIPCDGPIEWEAEGRWWWCRKCGHCSCWSTVLHEPAEHPVIIFRRGMELFLQQREKQGLNADQAMLQALHAIGMLLKALAMRPPDSLVGFVDRLEDL